MEHFVVDVSALQGRVKMRDEGATAQTDLPAVALTPEVEELLARDCVVAVGVSGGRDSQACALAVFEHLDRIGHAGPRLCVHADLGVLEWSTSGKTCERLAERVDVELMVVRRKAGDLMQRWETRWSNNVSRYVDLSCVKLIVPWSSPSLRFCTSELKSAVISSHLRARFPDKDILSVTGIRRQESAARKRMPVSQSDSRLARKRAQGITWNAIIDWSKDEVMLAVERSGLALHEAYTRYGSSRVSCVYCIMSSAADLLAATTCNENHDIYRRMVDLEVRSGFAFQGGKWLGDVAPHLLSEQLVAGLQRAKQIAVERQAIEAVVPTHLLYTDGWPTVMPNAAEAELLADVRRRVTTLMGFEAKCLSADAVTARYAELMALHAAKKAAA